MSDWPCPLLKHSQERTDEQTTRSPYIFDANVTPLKRTRMEFGIWKAIQKRLLSSVKKQRFIVE
jgi:hypothetical protein